MASTRNLDRRFRPYANILMLALRQVDRRFHINSGFRTRAEQEQLYSKFLRAQDQGLHPYTTLPPGKSQHERGLAIDVGREGIDPREDDILAAAGAIWRQYGFTWGGEDDPVHFGAPFGW